MTNTYTVGWHDDFSEFAQKRDAIAFARRIVKAEDTQMAIVKDGKGIILFAAYEKRGMLMETDSKSAITRLERSFYPDSFKVRPKTPVQMTRGKFKFVIGSKGYNISSLENAIEMAVARSSEGTIYKGQVAAGEVRADGSVWNLKNRRVHETTSLGGLFNSSYEKDLV
jgi:hypothetical protein